MSRKKRIIEKRVYVDPKYKSVQIGKFINFLMQDGKKSLAINIVYTALEELREKTGEEDCIKAFEKAVANVKPSLEVRSRRVGGATYQVPVEVEADRRDSLAVRWILSASRSRGGKSMVERLAGELLDAANNTGTAVKKREEVQKMAEANRAYAHYRW